MIPNTTTGTHNQRISAQIVTNRLLEIGKRPLYTMYVLYAAFLFWPSICQRAFAASPCADPESFFRVGPTLTTFFFFQLMKGRVGPKYICTTIIGPPAVRGLKIYKRYLSSVSVK